MTKSIILITFLSAAIFATGCNQEPANTDFVVKPLYTTDTVQFDSDDPAIWVNPKDPAQSLVIGTDKDENGALYVFDLKGKSIPEKTVHGLKRPNNVDIAYGLSLGVRK